MNIHEYQAKGLLRNYGAPVSDGRIVVKSEDAKTAAGELDGPVWVCLLYTSPSPRDRTRSRMPSSA